MEAPRDPSRELIRAAPIRLLARTLLLILVFAALAEIGARLGNRFCLPILPYRVVAGVPELPKDDVLCVRFRGEFPVTYRTNSAGFRVDDSADADRARIFIAGDSQVLGYGFHFEDTFAARLSKTLYGDPGEAAILGTPAMDPEMLGHAIRLHRAALPDALPVAVLSLNLANDLDEVFTAGEWYRGTDQPNLQAWLLRNSVAWMTLVQRSFARRVDQVLIPGINRIFYITSAEERVLLMRETVDLLIGSVKDIGATRSFVLLIPQDIQAFPEDFAKYRSYFRDETAFAKWSAAVPGIAREFDLLEDYAASRLERAGMNVVRLSRLFPPDAAAELYLSRTSHHYLPAAHALVADEIARRLRGSSEDGNGE